MTAALTCPMKKLLSILLIITFSIGISVSIKAQDIEIPVKAKLYTVHYDFLLLKSEYNPQLSTDGTVELTLKPSEWGFTNYSDHFYSFPSITISYKEPKVIKSGGARIKSFLKTRQSPRVFIRVPDKMQNSKFIGDIEMILCDLGWTVIDNSLIKDTKNLKEIKTRTGADLILDVSWLKFSDPDMYSTIDISKSEINNFYGKVGGKDLYYSFKNWKDLEKYQKDRNSKHFKDRNRPYRDMCVEADLSGYKSLILQHMSKYERFNINKNVVSAVFKFINANDGALLGYYHIGETPDIKLSGGVGIHPESYYPINASRGKDFYDESTFYRDNKQEISSKIILTALSYMDIYLPNGEIPFAAQLNEMEDVKLSDDKIQESYKSTSTTNGHYSGHSRDYYNAYFNSRYYSGIGSGNYSGSSSSTINSSGSATTTFKDAEYIRYSDFFGYYKPLTEKLVKEIQSLMAD